jgi:ubiquinone/menaquinone biosynthesis C-methylase UbiE
MLDTAPQPFTLDMSIEDEVRQVLTEHFESAYQDRIKNYVDGLLGMDGFGNRFEYLKSVVGPDVFQSDAKILVSGCGAGSEMLTARQFGFGHVYGVEVEQFWLTVCEMRMRNLPNMHVSYYDGESLPYKDDEFDALASGHVIEHTKNPEQYLRECMRVLAQGGYLSLEFPHRYHHTELHTHLPSFEWLPRPLRNAILRALASSWSPLKKDVKTGYHNIVITELKQISMGGVNRMLKRIGYPFSIVSKVQFIPGVTRCVIRKD